MQPNLMDIRGASHAIPKDKFSLSDWRATSETFLYSIAIGQEEIAPFIVMVCDPEPEGDSYMGMYIDITPFMSDPDSKYALGSVIGDFVERYRGFASMMFTEAWLAKSAFEDVEEFEKRREELGAIANFPDKEEVIIVAYQSKLEKSVKVLAIEREGSVIGEGRISGLSEQPAYSKIGTHYEMGAHMKWFDDPTPVAMA